MTNHTQDIVDDIQQQVHCNEAKLYEIEAKLDTLLDRDKATEAMCDELVKMDTPWPTAEELWRTLQAEVGSRYNSFGFVDALHEGDVVQALAKLPAATVPQ